jgi:hypothetical protein
MQQREKKTIEGKCVIKVWQRCNKKKKMRKKVFSIFSNNTFGFKPLDCLLSSVGKIIRNFNQISKKKNGKKKSVSSLEDPILQSSSIISSLYPSTTLGLFLPFQRLSTSFFSLKNFCIKFRFIQIAHKFSSGNEKGARRTLALRTLTDEIINSN